MTQLISHVSPQSLTEVLQAAGYRVNQTEQNGIVQLLSASQGIGYAVRFGNPAVEQGSYVDFTFSCALRVQGELQLFDDPEVLDYPSDLSTYDATPTGDTRIRLRPTSMLLSWVCSSFAA